MPEDAGAAPNAEAVTAVTAGESQARARGRDGGNVVTTEVWVPDPRRDGCMMMARRKTAGEVLAEINARLGPGSVGDKAGRGLQVSGADRVWPEGSLSVGGVGGFPEGRFVHVYAHYDLGGIRVADFVLWAEFDDLEAGRRLAGRLRGILGCERGPDPAPAGKAPPPGTRKRSPRPSRSSSRRANLASVPVCAGAHRRRRRPAQGHDLRPERLAGPLPGEGGRGDQPRCRAAAVRAARSSAHEENARRPRGFSAATAQRAAYPAGIPLVAFLTRARLASLPPAG
jgi:hypothetical protein